MTCCCGNWWNNNLLLCFFVWQFLKSRMVWKTPLIDKKLICYNLILDNDYRYVSLVLSYLYDIASKQCLRMIHKPSKLKDMGRWQSGQLQQTVNLSPHGYVGSNPTLPRLNFIKIDIQNFRLYDFWLLGPLAHLARAPALHAGGDRFDPDRVQI